MSPDVAFGKPIVDQGVVRTCIAESRVKVEQLPLLVLRTAWLMDTVGNKAHTEIQAIKIATPEIVQWRTLRSETRRMVRHQGLEPRTR